ncbi:MAG TPA: type II toxin-antitoxin system RelE/ParE family toxin [Roseiarcus sp.]|nr:type II toxin-antitoxin system RelE/ParE family toxin [Roseiarcus sp.]
MRRATFLASVRADLIDILAYVAETSGSVAVAQGFVSDLRTQCHKLAALEATVGRPRPELRVDIRSFPFKGYVIFFRHHGERFEVVNIIEGHRDIDAVFGGKDKR